MQGYNVIMVYNRDFDKILMCKRSKDPYKGLLNLVGGKIEPSENGMNAAYRELREETSITRRDINLVHLMDFKYYISDCYVEVYAGILRRDVEVSGDENELLWLGLEEDFFDMKAFAGEGNIGHMHEQVKEHRQRLFQVNTRQTRETLSFEEFAQMLDEIANNIPEEIYIKLNGGVNLQEGFKIHPEAKNNDLFVLGEYCKDKDLGRYINIYYDSFRRAWGHLNYDALYKKVDSTLRHEFLHHLEGLAGEKDLEIQDAEFIAKYKKGLR